MLRWGRAFPGDAVAADISPHGVNVFIDGELASDQAELAGAADAVRQVVRVRVQVLRPGADVLRGQMQGVGSATLEPDAVTVGAVSQDMALAVDQRRILPAEQISDTLLVFFMSVHQGNPFCKQEEGKRSSNPRLEERCTRGPAWAQLVR